MEAETDSGCESDVLLRSSQRETSKGKEQGGTLSITLDVPTNREGEADPLSHRQEDLNLPAVPLAGVLQRQVQDRLRSSPSQCWNIYIQFVFSLSVLTPHDTCQ